VTKRIPIARPPDVADDDFGIGDASVGVHKGRGAVSNPSGRYEKEGRVSFHDGWDSEVRPDEEGDDPRPRLDTIITAEHTRTIITTNDSPDVPFDQSINPYKG
jgi:hypothetical protein